MEVQKENSDCMLEGWEKEELVVIFEPIMGSELPLDDCAYSASCTNDDYTHNK